jgi:hypothetical protein
MLPSQSDQPARDALEVGPHGLCSDGLLGGNLVSGGHEWSSAARENLGRFSARTGWPYCSRPLSLGIPELVGELTDEPAGINAGTRATDRYYCGAPLLCPDLGSLIVAASSLPLARRTARKWDIKFGDAHGVDIWRAAVEQALRDEAKNPNRDPNLPPIIKTKMMNKFGQRAFEGYPWA